MLGVLGVLGAVPGGGFSAPLSAVAFLLGAAVSTTASALLVSRLERIAGRVRVSEATLGFVVALAADAPEITSSVTASARGQHLVGAGIVLGSNAFNIAALLGLGAVVAGRITLHRRVVVVEGTVGVAVAAAGLLAVAGVIDTPAALAAVLVAVGAYVLVGAGTSVAALRRVWLPRRLAVWLRRAIVEEEQELRPAIHPLPPRRFDFAIAAGAIAAVVGASIVMEEAASAVGTHYALPAIVVGGVVLAAVTSLPNAVGAIYLARRGRGAAVLSEAMNSNMINVLVGLLLPALFLGLPGPSGAGTLVASWAAAMTIAAAAVAYAGKGLGRAAGSSIIVAYLVFVAVAVAAAR